MLFLSLVACAPLVGLAVYDFVAQPPVALLYVAAPDVLLFVALLVWVALSLLLCASLWLASPRRKAAAASETRRDALLAAHLAVALGWMAGPAVRLDRLFTAPAASDVLFLPALLGYAAFVTAVYACCKPRETLATGRAFSWAMAVPAASALFVVSDLLFGFWRVSPAAFGVAGVAALLVAAVYALFLSAGRVHLHHWHYPIPLILLCVLDTPAASAAQAALVAVHLHGLGTYGAQGIFHENDPEPPP